MEQSIYTCHDCRYFTVCGNNMRTLPCKGRKGRREMNNFDTFTIEELRALNMQGVEFEIRNGHTYATTETEGKLMELLRMEERK